MTTSLSKDSIYRILKSFDKIYDKFTDAEKNRFISSVFYKGVETQEVDLSDESWDYQRSLKTVCLLERK